MGRKALLIGLDVYSFIATQAKPPALANLEAFKTVLLSRLGQFLEEDVETLINPDAQQMRQAIERLSSRCRPHDVRLLYFCGLGVIDPLSNRFYLAGYDTQPLNLINTAISDGMIRALLSSSHCRHQVVLLDSCWGHAGPERQALRRPPERQSSAAQALASQPLVPQPLASQPLSSQLSVRQNPVRPGSIHPTTARSALARAAAERIDAERPVPELLQGVNAHHVERLVSPLAGNHRAVLWAQNPDDGTWPTTEDGLSEYTHCLVEGIETGLADIGADGLISIQDLHQYIEQSLERLSMRTQANLQAPGSSPDIELFKLPQYNPEAEYRRGVEEYVTKDQGQISEQSRQVLNFLRTNLGLGSEISNAIEADVLRPYQERQERLRRYEQAFAEAIKLENPPRKSVRRWLQHLQNGLFLTYEDITQIETRILSEQALPFGRPAQRLEPVRTEIAAVRVAPLESDSPYEPVFDQRTGTSG